MKKSKEIYMELHGEEDAKRYAMDMANASPFGQLWTECQEALNNIDVVKWIDTVVENAETYYFVDVSVGNVRVKYCEIRDEGFNVYFIVKGGSTHAKKLFDWGIDDQWNESFKEKIKKQFFDFLKENQGTIEMYV